MQGLKNLRAGAKIPTKRIVCSAQGKVKMADIMSAINDNYSDILNNLSLINVNKADIVDNKNNIVRNAAAIAKNTGNIVGVGGKLTTIHDLIDANKNSIDENARQIKRNVFNIASHKKQSDSNFADIWLNLREIIINTAAIKDIKDEMAAATVYRTRLNGNILYVTSDGSAP